MIETLVDSPIAATENGNGNHYALEDKRYIRVTHALHSVLPPYLVPYAENTGHSAMHRVMTENPGISLHQAKDMIKDMGLDCESQKKAGGNRGAEIHYAVEAWITQGVPPNLDDFEPEHRPFARTLCQWLLDYAPEFEHSELTVWHPTEAYAGTIDAIGKVTKQPKGVRHENVVGKRLIFDFKTNKDKRIYVQHYFQLAAYELALQQHEVEVEGSAVVAIGPTPWKNSGKPYTLGVNYIRPDQWKPIMNTYRTLEATKKQNPNAR